MYIYIEKKSYKLDSLTNDRYKIQRLPFMFTPPRKRSSRLVATLLVPERCLVHKYYPLTAQLLRSAVCVPFRHNGTPPLCSSFGKPAHRDSSEIEYSPLVKIVEPEQAIRWSKMFYETGTFRCFYVKICSKIIHLKELNSFSSNEIIECSVRQIGRCEMCDRKWNWVIIVHIHGLILL